MIGGNIAILAASAVARRTRPHDSIPVVPGVNHLHAVDRRVWRSSAPTREAYRTLAARNVRTVVDLRAEDDVREDGEFLLGLGVELVRFPIRDGQTPSAVQANQFIEAVQSFEGVVLVHCGAGVGRTGTMAAAYLVRSGEATPNEALWRNLAVGPAVVRADQLRGRARARTCATQSHCSRRESNLGRTPAALVALEVAKSGFGERPRGLR